MTSASVPPTDRAGDEPELLVVSRGCIDEIGGETGVHEDWRAYARAIFGGSDCRLMGGRQAERDERFKQLVVYVLLEHRGRFLHYSRRARNDDPRLRGRSSVGWGGHIDAGDVDEPPRGLELQRAVELLLRVGEREVHEELSIDSGYDPVLLGVVNDERDPVGRVHLGFVALWRLTDPHVKAREAGICDVGFLTVAELLGSDRPLEGWTQLCLEHLQASDIR